MCCVNLGWPQAWIQFVQPKQGQAIQVVPLLVEIEWKTEVVTCRYRAQKPPPRSWRRTMAQAHNNLLDWMTTTSKVERWRDEQPTVPKRNWQVRGNEWEKERAVHDGAARKCLWHGQAFFRQGGEGEVQPLLGCSKGDGVVRPRKGEREVEHWEREKIDLEARELC